MIKHFVITAGAALLIFCILDDVHRLSKINSAIKSAHSFFTHEINCFYEEYGNIDTILFNYQQFMGSTRLENTSQFNEVSKIDQMELDTLIAGYFDPEYMYIGIDNEEYYNWLQQNDFAIFPHLHHFRQARIREMYYDLLQSDFSASICYFYIPKFEFARSIGEDSIYFGAYDFGHDHTKYLININGSQFDQCCESTYTVPKSDTLHVTLYEVGLIRHKLDTISDAISLVWNSSNWEKN